MFVPRWLPTSEPRVGLPYRIVPALSALIRNGIEADLVFEPRDGPFPDGARRLLDGAAAAVVLCAELNPAEQLPGLRAFLAAVAAHAPALPRFVSGGFVPLTPADFDYEGLATPLRGDECNAVLQALPGLAATRQPFGVEALYALDLRPFAHPAPLLFGNGDATLQLPTGLGCGKACQFCFYEHARLRLLPAPAIAQAMQHCVARYGVRQFQLGELDFLAAPTRALAFADELRTRALQTRWFALASVQDLQQLDDAKVRALAAAGLTVLELGIETGTDSALCRLGKRFMVADALAAHRRLVANGITPVYNFMFGWPGETAADRRAAVRLVERLQGSAPRCVFHFRQYQAIPGTTFGDRVLAREPLPHGLTELAHWRVGQARQLPWLPARDAARVRALIEHWLPLGYADELAGPRPSLRRRALGALARLRCRTGCLSLPLDRRLFAAAAEAPPRSTLLL